MSQEKPFALGFVGLGIMGAPMVRRLRAQGWTVTVWNLEPERFEDVRESGAVWADSPAAVAAASDAVLVCVLGDDAIESVTLGENGLSKGGERMRAVLDTSTTSVAATRRLAEAMAGTDWVDAPMSGGPGAAEEGKLTMMVGAEPDAFETWRPVLEDLAGNLTLMGPVGAGQTTKVINQAIVGVNYVLMAEMLALAEAADIDGKTLISCLAGGMADSTVLQRIFPQMVERDFDPPRSYARQLDKDLKSVKSFVGSLGLDLPVVATAVSRYAEYVAKGNAMRDGASVSRLYVGD